MKKSTPTVEDVTRELEQLKAEFELFKKNQVSDYQYKLIVDNISDVLFTCTLSFELTYLSPSAERLFGASLDSLHQITIEQLLPPRALSHVRTLFQKEMAEDTAEKALLEPYVTNELEMYKADGSIMWVSIRSSFSRNSNGEPSGIIGVLRDITSSKLAQLEFQRMQLLDEQMSQLARVGAWELDLQTNTVYWSDMTKIIHEVPLDFVPQLSSDISFYKDIETRDRFHNFVNNAIQYGTPFTTEFKINTAKGNERWIRTIAEPEIIDGKCVRIVGALQDIDELKRTQLSLEYAHNLYNDIARYSRTIVWEVDTNGLFTYVSSIANELLGYTADELVGKMHFYDLCLIEQREEFKNSALAVFKTKESFHNFVNPMLTKSGEVLYVFTNGIPILDKQGNLMGYKGSDTDITEQTKIKTAFDSQIAFQSLIAAISKEFIGISRANFDEKFNLLFQRIGEFLQVDRTYLFEATEDEQYMSNTFEWCADGIFSVKEMLQNYPLADLPMIEQLLKQRKMLFVPNVDELPDIYTAERLAMQEQAIKTVLVLPVVKNERLFGYFGFDAVKQTREVPPYQIELLQVVANMIGDVLLKNTLDKANEQYLQQVLRQEREKRALLDSMDDLVFVLDKELVYVDFYQPQSTSGLYLSPEAFLGKSFISLDFPEPAKSEILAKEYACFQTGKPQSVEYVLTINEEIRWFDLRITPLHNESQETIGLVCVARDMTESMIQKQLLIQSDVLLQKLVEQTPGMVYQYQYFPEGRTCFPFASNHIYDIYELHPEDVKYDASNVLTRIHPDDVDAVMESIKVSYDNLSIWDFEYRVVLPIQGSKWLKGIARPEKLADDSVLWHGYIYDNTEKKNTEIELAKTKERLELAIHGTNDGVFDWNIQEGMHYLSPRWKLMLGYADDELPSEHATFDSLLHPEDKERVLSHLSNYIKGIEPDYSTQFRMLHKDGTSRWILARGKAVRDKNGRAIRFAGSHTDVHEQQLAMLRLEEQNDFIQSLINTMPDLIFYKDIQGVYRLCNERFARFNNTTVDACIGKRDADVVSPEYAKMFAETDEQVVATKQSLSTSHWDTYPDGRRALHHTVKTPHINAKGEVVGIVGVSRDIAEIHEVQAELSKTKKQLESVFNEMEEVVWSMSMPSMEVNFISPAAEKLFDTTLSKHQGAIGPWWKQYIHPEDAHIIDIIFGELHATGVYDKSYRIVTEKGNTKQIRCRGKFIFDESGMPTRLDGVMTDRTIEAVAHQRIVDEINLQKILLQTAADFIHVDIEQSDEVINASLQHFGIYVGADRAYVFDYDIDNMVTHNTYEWCAEGITAEIDNLQNLPLDAFHQWYDEHKQRKTFYCYDVQALDPEDSLRQILEPQGIVSIITVPMFDGNRLIGFVGFDYVKDKRQLSEIQEKLLYFFADMLANTRKRQRWELQLSLEEEKLRNILANVDMGLLEMDNNQQITYANNAFLLMSGHNENAILYKKANELFPLVEHYNNQNYIDYQHIDIAELHVLDNSMRKRWWFVSSTPNYNDKGERVGYIAVHMDITHQRELAIDLEKAKISAEKSAQAKDVFLANMSHEIRTPLNIIVGMIRQLGKENLSEQQRYYVKQTDTSSRHLLAIVNNILDVAKIESSDISIDKKPFSLIAMLQNVESLMSQQAQEKQIEYTSQIAPQLHAVHVGDELRLRQILINIVGNAVKFTQKGAICVEVDVLQDKPNSQFIRIQVEDTGIGIGKEFLKGIFNKFTQEDTASNRLHQGTGLGLSISKELVQLMGGSIEIASTKGKGSLFTIFLDLEKASVSQLVVEKPYVLQNSLRDYAVLLVEDNEMNRYIAKQSLAFLGCTVTEAENGKIAIGILKQTTFDLILMDIQMPVMDGIEATQFIRNDLKLSVPIIALTANAYAQKLDNYVQQGMDDYITKPFDEEAFYQKISRFLRLKPQEDNVIAEESSSVDLGIQEVADLYDLQQLQNISKGDVAFVQKMLELFVRLAEQHCVELQEALLEKDLTRINKLAHKIKPSIDQMGIVRLRDKIRTIEQFSLQTNTQEELDLLVNEVCRVLQAVVFDLKKHI